MEEEKKSPIDKGLSLRSEEVNEVMGAIPPWIARWGMVLMALILLGVGIGAYTFTVPEYLEVPYIVKGSATPIAQLSPSGGILRNLADEQARLHEGQPVATLRTQGRDTLVKANATGSFNRNLLYPAGTRVTAGDTIGWVTPPQKMAQTILLKIPASGLDKIHIGSVVHLMWIDGKAFSIGQIQAVAAVPTGNVFLAAVRLQEDSASQPPAIGLPPTGRAKIVISEQRLIDKLSLQKLK